MKKILTCLLLLFTATGHYAQEKLSVVAIAPFEVISGISPSDAEAITRVFYIELKKKSQNFILVDRSVIEKAEKEHYFQTNEWSNDEKTAKLKEALNADWIIRSEFQKFEGEILVTIQFYDLNSFEFNGGTHIKLKSPGEIYNKMDDIVAELLATIDSGAKSSKKEYNIGDKGLGDGIVFYIEGNTYYEVSPILGRGIWVRAWQVAETYHGGNCSDWKLPSRSSLYLIYRNLKQKGIGDFGDDCYWSSEQNSNYYRGNNKYYRECSGLYYLNFKDGNVGYDEGCSNGRNYETCSIILVRSFTP